MFATYHTISDGCEFEKVIKGSRFIAYCARCETEGDIRDNLEHIREIHPNATHYCYGAIFGGVQKYERFSDNGEPSGTAGKPIISILRGSSLTDVIIIVVRYFGGTLLGTGGLVEAYSDSAKAVVNNAERTEMVYCTEFDIKLDYELYGKYQSGVSGLDIVDQQVSFEDRISLQVFISEDRSDDFVLFIKNLTKGAMMVYPKCKFYVARSSIH